MILLFVVIFTMAMAGLIIRRLKVSKAKLETKPFLENPRRTHLFTKVEVVELLCKNPFLNWPRNLFCFCGSGRKFKKCHLERLDSSVSQQQARILEPDFKRQLAHVERLAKQGRLFKLKEPLY